MRTRRAILVFGTLWAAWACGGTSDDEAGLTDEVGQIQEGIKKGFVGAKNGDANYCDNPLALCTLGEGDCDLHSQCQAPYACIQNNGPKFGLAAGVDVCAGSHCYNKIKDTALGETQIDCGGECGTICSAPVCPPNVNGSAAHCTTDCRCASGQGDCNVDAECQTGLVCSQGAGVRFGFTSAVDMCIAPSCKNGVLDAPNETAVDCGGTCGTCPITASFTGLGDLPGGTVSSEANAVSSDGKVVVGVSESANGSEAFRWTKAGGIAPLGDLAGGVFSSIAYGVSTDGSVVVGRGKSATGSEAFRWTSAGMVALGDLPAGTTSSEAWGVSLDGSVVVGPGHSINGTEAFRWTSAGMTGIGDLPGGVFDSRAYASNSTGSAIVGRSASTNGTEAFRWTSAGMVGLGDLPGGTFGSVALGVSNTGSIVVGFGTTAAGAQAFRWATNTMVALPLPAGTTTSFAQGSNSSGTVIVGTATGAGGNVAFVWRSSTNTSVSIISVLNAAGVSTTGWTLQTAVAISYDGKWVVGRGLNPSGNTEGWLAQIP
jgi:probable HAF family extracellular repeat protein